MAPASRESRLLLVDLDVAAFERMLAGTGDHSVVLIPVLAVTSAATFVVLAIDVYAFPLLALQDAPVRDTVRAALALAAAAPGPTLGLLAAGALASLALAWLGPGTLLLSLPSFVSFLPSLAKAVRLTVQAALQLAVNTSALLFARCFFAGTTLITSAEAVAYPSIAALLSDPTTAMSTNANENRSH